jgi:Fe-S-cluster-containing dehydrogenase component
MALSRRDFLRTSALGGALAAIPASAEEKEKPMPQHAVGLLFDSTLCVGCKACVGACRAANNTHPEFGTKDKLWDAPPDLTPNTLTVIKAYTEGGAQNKDQEQNGYAFIKRSCLHCVDPSCVSVCPVKAMTKDPDSGIVSYNPDRCIGCRYCVAACPFSVPRFEFNKALPRLYKCELCKQRQAKGEIPACADVCPTGATLFGPVTALQVEADRRHALKPGETTFFPRKTVGSKDVTEKVAPHYLPATYGESEVGGTQVRFLAGVPFDKLGYPKLPKKPYVDTSEGIQHTLYKGMVAPVAVFVGLLYFASRTAKHEEQEEHGEDKKS